MYTQKNIKKPATLYGMGGLADMGKFAQMGGIAQQNEVGISPLAATANAPNFLGDGIARTENNLQRNFEEFGASLERLRSSAFSQTHRLPNVNRPDIPQSPELQFMPAPTIGHGIANLGRALGHRINQNRAQKFAVPQTSSFNTGFETGRLF